MKAKGKKLLVKTIQALIDFSLTLWEKGHKWCFTFGWFGLSCDIPRQDAKEYLLALC